MSEPSGIRVTVRHIRAALDGCYPGARAFARRHGLDAHEMVRNGLPVEQIEATGDAMALRVAAYAREEAARGR